MSRLGYTASEFYDTTPIELYYALKDVNERNEQKSKDLYEASRLNAVLVINPFLSEGHKITRPSNYYRFPWDSVPTVDIPTKADWAALDKKYSKN